MRFEHTRFEPAPLPATAITDIVAAADNPACGPDATAADIAEAQRTQATAVRHAAAQIGGGFAIAGPDYSQGPFLGGSVYATLDFSTHLGVEFMFHQVNSRREDQISERTYELGPRYVLHYGAFEPFVRASYGRGVFNFPNSVANLAYNMFTLAGGADIRLSRHVYARGEYEVQRWYDFPAERSAAGGCDGGCGLPLLKSLGNSKPRTRRALLL